METLLKQITADKFKPSNFTVFNIIDDSGFIEELIGMFNIRYSIEDFDYMLFELSTKEKNAIYYRMSSVIGKFKEIKRIVEKEMQDDQNKPKAKMIIDKDKSIVMIVKLKEFDLVERLKKIGKKSED